MSNWTDARCLLWDDDEQILTVDSVKHTSPMKEAGKVQVQPKASYCCGNSFRPNTTRRKDSVKRFHTWVVEFDNMPLDEQRKMWAASDMPHTLRVFSGNKSIHVYIRTEEDISFAEWKQIASDLKLIFPQADTKVLTDCARLSRLPGGIRDDGTVQNVETAKERVPLKTLTDWIARQNVIKDKGIKTYRDRDIEKNSPSLSSPDVGKTIRAMNEADETYKRQHPERSWLYETLVGRRVAAERGKRNAQLMGLVTFLHEAVSEPVLMEFVAHFYRANAMAFNDPLEQHLAEAHAHRVTLAAEYPSRLSVREKAIYDELPDGEQVFFRICRSFAYGDDSPAGEMTFNLPMTHFGIRMGLDGTQISRLIGRFQVYGLLEQVKKGTQTRQNEDKTVIRGKAGVYRWTG